MHAHNLLLIGSGSNITLAMFLGDFFDGIPKRVVVSEIKWIPKSDERVVKGGER